MTELRLPDVNRVILSGRLTRVPEKRYAGDGTPISSFTLAFHRRYRGEGGRYVEDTGFVSVRAYQRLAELCGQRLGKGSPVLVEGRLQMREWTDRDGKRQTRLEIRAENVHFLERVAEPAELPGLEAPQPTDESGESPS
jgi:single-strand DNA-binding protein